MSAVEPLDATILVFAEALRRPWLTSLMRGWTLLGGTFFVSCATLALAAGEWRRGRRDTAGVAVAIVGGAPALSMALKVIVGRVRPSAAEALVPLPVTHSFPSGHAMASLCLAAAVGLTVSRHEWLLRFRTPVYACLAIYVLGVGFSRVYLGVHWLSDVVGSWLIGGVFVIVVVTVDRVCGVIRGRAASGS